MDEERQRFRESAKRCIGRTRERCGEEDEEEEEEKEEDREVADGCLRPAREEVGSIGLVRKWSRRG